MMNEYDRRVGGGAVSGILRAVAITCLAVLVRPHAGRAQPFDGIQLRLQQRIAVAVGGDAGPNAMVLADVNADGKPDIVAIDQDDDGVWVLFGHGDGSFDVPEDPIDLLGTPTAVVVADVSSPEGGPDNKPDIIVTESDGDFVEILLKDPEADGGFSSNASQDLTDLVDDAENTVALVLGAWDASPEIDLAILDQNDDDVTRVIFLCNFSGNFGPCDTFALPLNGDMGPVDLAGGDFDGDGIRDVAALSQESHTVTILYGNGNGEFEAGASADARADTSAAADNIPFAMAAGKLDGPDDAIDDLVIANAEDLSDTITLVLHAEGGRRFTRIAATGDFNVRTSVALGDLNGDDYLDAGLSSAAPPGETISGPAFLINEQDHGGFADSLASVRIVGGRMGEGQAIAMRDLDRDGLIDVVQVSADGERIDVAINISDEGPPTPTATVTMTPTITATRTATPPRIADDDGCAVVPGGTAGGAELMVGLALLAMLARRRRAR